MPLKSGKGCIFGLALGSFLVANTVLLHGDDAPAPAAAAPASGATSTTPDLRQSAYRDSIAQETVRNETDKVLGDLLGIIQEMKLNGMSTTQITEILKASNRLSNLSKQDMQKVVDALQDASATPEQKEQQNSLLTAYQGQQNIAVDLNTLASSFASQAALNAISLRIQSLLVRQISNIRQTTALKARSDDPAKLTGPLQSLHEIVGSNQASLGKEIDLLASSLSVTANSKDSTAPGTKAVSDYSAISLIASTTASATQFTVKGPLTIGVAKQTSVRDYLDKILHLWAAREDPATRLNDAKAQVSQLVNDQQALADEAKDGKMDPQTLADRQARINDEAETSKDLLKAVNDAAATQVAQAQQDMTQTAQALAQANQSTPPDTSATQAATLTALNAANQLLDLQTQALAQVQQETPAQALAQLTQLKNQIDQDQQQAQNDQKQPPPTQQADASQQQPNQNNQQPPPNQNLAANVSQLAQQAAAQAPDANAPLADAADALQQPQPNDTQAAGDLSQASASVQQQINALNQAAQNYQAQSQAQQQINQAEQQATDANNALQQDTPADRQTAASDLTAAQQTAANAAQDPQLSPDTQATLKKAADNLKNAAVAAVQGNQHGAQDQDKQAMQALQGVQAAVAQAMADASQQGRQALAKNSPLTAAMMANTQDTGQFSVGQLNPSRTSRSFVGGVANTTNGGAQVVGGLSPKDRDALTQYQAEKSPAEFAPLVQQYMKNLTDSSTTSP
jgi:hypothetical protein